MAKRERIYSKSHEWVEYSDETTAKTGITDHAQCELGDIVFVNLPEVGDTVTAGTAFADVESVKAVSDIYAPVSGTVRAVNSELLDHPEKINENAEQAWFVEIENITDSEELMNKSAYEAFAASEKSK